MRKKFLSVLMCVLMIVASCYGVLTVFAAETPYGIVMNIGGDETERYFSWYHSASDGCVEIAQADGNDFPEESTVFESVSIPSSIDGKNIHRAIAYGLEYDTEYVYRVKNGNDVSDIYRFKTDSKDEFQFIFVGDPQIGASGNKATDGENWRKTLEKAADMFPDASLLITAGDQVEKGNNESLYQQFLSSPLLPAYTLATTIGNHEALTDSSFDTPVSIYSEHFFHPNLYITGESSGSTAEGSNYCYSYNNTLFMHINLNNLSADDHKAYMEKAISLYPDARWRIVVIHYALYGAGPYFYEEVIESRREAIAPIIDELDIDVVLNGHEHVYGRSHIIKGGTAYRQDGALSSVTDPDGTLYVTASSSTGSKFYDVLSADKAPHIAVSKKSTATVSKVEINDNRFSISTYRVSDGTEIDQFEIIKTQGTESIVCDTHDKGQWVTAVTPSMHTKGLNCLRCTKCGSLLETAYIAPLVESAGLTNVALGKTYTTSELNLKNGKVKYPDEGGITMTDGIFAPSSAMYSDPAYIGFYKGDTFYTDNGYCVITVDLEKEYALDRFVGYVASGFNGDAGVHTPKNMTVYVSDDGTDWSLAGSVSLDDETYPSCIPADLTLKDCVTARYVQYRFVCGGGAWVMVAEVEAYKAENENETSTESSETSEESRETSQTIQEDSNAEESFSDENSKDSPDVLPWCIAAVLLFASAAVVLAAVKKKKQNNP